MTWPKRRRLVRLLVACGLASLCGGCAALIESAMGRSAYATGTWTGRLRSVTMRDYDEREYPAAALDIETGPRNLRGTYTTFTVDAEHDLVLLCRGQGIIDPAELNISVGSKVRVSGTLSGGSPLKSFAPKGSTGGIMEQVRMVSEGERNSNLVIDIQHGKPKVLKE